MSWRDMARPSTWFRSSTGSAGTRASFRVGALPLRVRLVALLVLLLLVALTLTSVATSAVMRRQLMDSTDSELRAAARPTASQVLNYYLGHRGDRFPTNYAVKFMPANGSTPLEVLPTGVALHPDIPTLPVNDPRIENGTLFTVQSTNGDMRWRVMPGQLVNGEATFAVAVPLRGVDTTVQRMLSFAILIGLVVIFSCAIVGWYGVRRAFRPLTQIEDTAAGIAAGDLTRRIPEGTANDEVASLSRSLNAMLAQIEQSFAVREASEERMSQFVADASHELRTPLAAVRGYAELFRQGAVSKADDVAGAMRRIEDESIRMGGLVEDLLLLTRLTPDSAYATHVLLPMLIISVGMAFVFIPVSSTALHAIGHHDAGVASAMINTSQQVGGALGTALLNTVAVTASAAYLTAHDAIGRAGIPAALTEGYIPDYLVKLINLPFL